jgi:enediyne biosynthesis protein E4
VTGQSSYLSVNDRRLHFGLGSAPVSDIEVRWPSGARERITGVAADHLVYITEGSGLTRVEAFS